MKYFRLHFDLVLRDWTGNLLKYSELDPAWILIFMCTVELLGAFRDDLYKHLDTQYRTYLSSDLTVGVLLNL